MDKNTSAMQNQMDKKVENEIGTDILWFLGCGVSKNEACLFGGSLKKYARNLEALGLQ